MSATRSFRLGYSIITWGGTPDLDQALGAIVGAGWEGAEFTGTSLEWLGTRAICGPYSSATNFP